MSENNSNNNFGSGLMLGSLLGAGAVFFLGTKKGKKLLKVLTEEGIDGIGEIAGLLNSDMDEDDIKRLKKNLQPKQIEKNVVKKIEDLKKSEKIQELQDKIDELKENETVQKLEPIPEDVKKEASAVGKQIGKSAKRLFKGIPKKLRK